MPPSYLVRQRPLRTKSTLTTPNEEAAEVVTPLSGRCPRRNPSRTTRCSTDLENTKVSSFNENRVFSANYQPYIKIWKIRKSRIDFFFIVRILLGWLVTSNYFYYSYARFGDFSFGKRNNFLLHRLTTNPIPWKPRYTAWYSTNLIECPTIFSPILAPLLRWPDMRTWVGPASGSNPCGSFAFREECLWWRHFQVPHVRSSEEL